MNEIETKPASKTPKRIAASMLDNEEGIAVRHIRFNKPNGVDLPGKYGANTLVAGGEDNQDRWDITYLPRIRHHRVVFTPGNREKKGCTFFIHESWALWEPLE